MLNNIDARAFLTRPLSKSAEGVIKNLWAPINENSLEIVSRHPNGIKGSELNILAKHYFHMEIEKELFDESINAFMCLLQNSVEELKPVDQSIFVTSFYYEKVIKIFYFKNYSLKIHQFIQMVSSTPEDFSVYSAKWLSKVY